MPGEFRLRPATNEDLADIAALYERARAAAVPAMPSVVHSPREIRDHVAGWDLGSREVWVAEDDRLLGFVAFTSTWLDSLYVEPAAQGAGVGSALLQLVLAQRPDGIALWVFASNEPARAFYRKHGLVELEHTDGSENEEGAPDLRMAWLGDNPLEFLRRQIDEVDRDVARLLARRVALTAAVQGRKPVGGQAGRDPRREREIAERVAADVPALGVDRVARIMDAIITESLEAATEDPGHGGSGGGQW